MVSLPPSAPPRAGRAGVMSFALVAVCLGYFVVILDTTIVNVALPALRHDLRSGVAGLQWVVDGYLLTFAALLLSAGALADRLGPRRTFLAGLGLFGVTSAACGVAPDIGVLIGARLVQGVAAAATVPASLALLRSTFQTAGDRARAVGAWGGVAGVGAASGPVLGGVLVSEIGWRAVFFVNVPIVVGAMVLTRRHVAAPPARARSLDPAAQGLALVAMGALTIALIEGGSRGFTSMVVAAASACGICAALFVVVERRVAEPMLPLGLFANPTFSGATAIGLLINLGFYGELFVVNLYLQQVLGYSALVAGLALLPQMVMVSVGSWVSGRVTQRLGSPRRTLLIGLTTGAAGLGAMVAAAFRAPYPALVVPMLAAGFGMSFTMPAATSAVVESAPAERAGLASGTINAARQLGGVIGIAVLGGLVSRHAFLPGMRVAMALSGAAFAAGAAIAFGTVERRRGRDQRLTKDEPGLARAA